MSYPPPGHEYRGWPQDPGQSPAPRVDVGAAVSYAWKKFTDNVGPWLLIIVAYAVVSIVVSIPSATTQTTFTPGDEMPDFSELVGFGSPLDIVLTVISWVASFVLQIALLRGALSELDGNKPGFADFFRNIPWGGAIVTSLLVGIGIGIIAGVIFGGGIAVAVAAGSVAVGIIVVLIGLAVVIALTFLTYFAVPFAIDKRLSPIDAISSSIKLISKNAGSLFVLALALTGITIAGALACLVGLLAAVPVVSIASMYAYRVLTGGTVSPVGVPNQPWPQYPPQQYPPQQYPQQQPYGGGFSEPPYPPFQGGGFPPPQPPQGPNPPPQGPNPPQPPPPGGFPPPQS